MKLCSTLKMSSYRKYLKCLFITVAYILLSGCASIQHFISPHKQYNAQHTAPIERVDSTQNQYYTVQTNETLYQVAKKFNVTERALILWNNLKSPYTLKKGQVLQVFPNQPTKNITQAKSTLVVEEVHNDDIYSLDDGNLSYDVVNIQDETITLKEDPTKKASLENKETVSEDVIISDNISQAKREAVDGQYVVQSGDSLLSIANSFNLSLSQIANINNIQPPYPVYIGQRLTIDKSIIETQADTATKQSDVSSSEVTSPKKTQPEVKLDSKPVQSNQTEISSNLNSNKEWQWPIISKTVIYDSDTIALLEGTYHQPIRSACSGKVIYAGIGVEGYGKMIIIACGNNYMTAYSNLNMINVKEGETIKAGMIIGELGKFKGESVLSFEIRKDGTPVPVKSLIVD